MSVKNLVSSFRSFFKEIDRIVFGNKFPPGFSFAEADVYFSYNNTLPQQTFSIKEFMQESILWAVPKKRRSIERRLKRKFGTPDGLIKLYLPIKDLLVCAHCGHDYKRGYLCKNCYTKVMDETKRMQDRIREELKLDPVDEEVVVLYKGESDDKSKEFWKGKRIVEMPVERPSWFSRNLLQKTTTTTSDTKDIKPDNLG